VRFAGLPDESGVPVVVSGCAVGELTYPFRLTLSADRQILMNVFMFRAQRSSSFSATAALILIGIAPSGWSQIGNGALKILTDPAASGMQRFYRLRQW
jgi:hypothetical protein